MSSLQGPDFLLAESVPVLLHHAEQLVRLLRRLSEYADGRSPQSADQPTEQATGLCRTCQHRDVCTSPCEAVAASLPRLDDGRKQTADARLRLLSEDRRPRSWHEDRYRACMAIHDELTAAEFKVVSAVFGDAITQAEAAKRLNRSPSTISEHIKNVKAKLLSARSQAIASEGTADLALLSEQLGLDLSGLDLDSTESS